MLHSQVMRFPLFGLFSCLSILCVSSVFARLVAPPRVKRMPAVADYESDGPNEVDMPQPQIGGAGAVHRPAEPPSSAFGNRAPNDDDSSEEIVFKVGRNIIPYSRFKKELERKLRKGDQKDHKKMTAFQMVDGNSRHEAVLNTLMVSSNANAETHNAKRSDPIPAPIVQPAPSNAESTTQPPLTITTIEPTTVSVQREAPESTPRVVTLIQPNVPVPIKIRQVKFRPVAERFRKLATLPSLTVDETTPNPSGITTEPPELPIPVDLMGRKIVEHVFSSLPDKLFVGRNYIPREVFQRNERILKKKEKEKMEKEKMEKEKMEKENLEKGKQEKQEQEKGNLEKEKLEKETQAKEKEEKAKFEAELKTATYNVGKNPASDLPLQPAETSADLNSDLKLQLVPAVVKNPDQFVDNNRLLERTTKTVSERQTTQPFSSTPSSVPFSKPLPTETTLFLVRSTFAQPLSLTPTSQHPTFSQSSTLSHSQSRIQFLNFTPAPRKPNRKNRLNSRGHLFHLKSGQLARAQFIASVQRLVASMKHH